MGLLDGKTALVAGVANRRSIAWAIARRLHEEGATLAFTYQGERLEKGVRDLAGSIGSELCVECDVGSDESLDRAFEQAADGLGGLDLLVHSVAFAQAHDLEGRFTDTQRQDFLLAVDISAYSLVAMARRAEPGGGLWGGGGAGGGGGRGGGARGGGPPPPMPPGGGGGVVPHYNVMGV